MNRKQRRSAKHRSPALAHRAVFEDRLRTALKQKGVRLLSAEVGSSDKKPTWVLVVEREGLQVTLSAVPGTVSAMTEAVLWRLDHLGEEPEPVQAAVTQGPDAQPSSPGAVTVHAEENVLARDGGDELAALIPGGR